MFIYKVRAILLSLSLLCILNSNNANATLLTWDITFEVTYVSDEANLHLSDAVSVTDILYGVISYNDDTPMISDNGYVTYYDDASVMLDIAALTSNDWLTVQNTDVATIDQDSREVIAIDGSYSNTNGPIFWESLDFGFLDYSNKYTSLPTNWHTTPDKIDFSYFRDVISGNNSSEVFISGEATSVTLRDSVQVSEPASIASLVMALFFMSVYRRES